MEKYIAWSICVIAYILYFWGSPLLWKPGTPYWLRVVFLHSSGALGILLGMLISWVIKVLVLG